MKRIIFLFLLLSVKIIAQPNYCLTLSTNSVSNYGVFGWCQRTELNNDGKHDYISTFYYSNTFSVFISNGGVGYNPPVTYSIPILVEYKVADCNGDGNKDIISSDSIGNIVKVILGTSAGNFTNTIQSNAGIKPYRLTMDDFNNDGKKDIAVINRGTNQVSILLGLGTGSFSAPSTLNCIGKAENIDCRDFDNDGNKDLLISYTNNTNLTIYKGNGNGTFGLFSTYNINTTYDQSIIADFNNDTKLDVAILSPNLKIAYGNGNCTFTSQATYSYNTSGFRFSAGDVNGDNQPDIAIGNGYNFWFDLLLSNSSGGFLPVISSSVISTSFINVCPGNLVPYIDIVDFNYDNKNDLVFGSDNPTCTFYVLQNCNTVGLTEDEFTTTSFNVFPNPAKDVLNIELTEQASTALSLTNNKNNEIVSHPERSRRVFIINTLGQTVLQQYLNGDKTSINLNDLKAGFYFIEVQTEFGVLSKKIVIEK